MARMPEGLSPTERVVQYLLDRRFGLNWQSNEINIGLSAERMGRKNPGVAAAAEKYGKQLRAMSAAELKALYDQEIAKDLAEQAAKSEKEEQERFFNWPHNKADFEHWSKAAYWTMDEAIALTLGRAPERVNWKAVAGYVQVSAFATSYARLRDLSQRAVTMKQIADSNIPWLYLGWARRNGYEPPAELVSKVESRGHQIADWPALLKDAQDKLSAEYDRNERATQTFAAAATETANRVKQLTEAHNELLKEKEELIEALVAENAELKKAIATHKGDELNPKGRASLLRLVLGMAIDGYGYDPKVGRSPAHQLISGSLVTRGIKIDADTVRTWLKAAADEVDYHPNQDD